MKVSLGAANLQTFCLQVGEISPGKKRYGNTALGQFCPVVGSEGAGSNDGSAWELGNGVLGFEGHWLTLREVDFFSQAIEQFCLRGELSFGAREWRIERSESGP